VATLGIQGKTIVFTGRGSKPRYEFQMLVGEHGGIAGSDISKNTDYLVVGEKPGSKLARATMLGVPTISEEEFLKLLAGGTEAIETPLTSTQLAKLEEDMVTFTCLNCNKEYKQWNTLPNYETCPICEIFSASPSCPHCSDDPIFVTDFGLYHCRLCGTWFKAPYSIQSKCTKHIHLWLEPRQTLTGIRKTCPCGTSILLSQEDIEDSNRRYNEAPLLVKKWNEESRIRKKREELKNWFCSLTEEQIHQIEEKKMRGSCEAWGKEEEERE